MLDDGTFLEENRATMVDRLWSNQFGKEVPVGLRETIAAWRLAKRIFGSVTTTQLAAAIAEVLDLASYGGADSVMKKARAEGFIDSVKSPENGNAQIYFVPDGVLIKYSKIKSQIPFVDQVILAQRKEPLNLTAGIEILTAENLQHIFFHAADPQNLKTAENNIKKTAEKFSVQKKPKKPDQEGKT